MASNPYVNKVEYAGQTLMDLTGDTVTPSDVLAGATFHDRSGSPQTGNLITHNVYDGLDSTSASDALSAKQGKNIYDIIIKTEEIINSGSTLNALVTALNTAVSNMATNSCKAVRIYLSEDVSVFGKNVAYLGHIFKSGSSDYCRIILYAMGSSNRIINGTKSSGDWDFKTIPQVIDGLNSTSATDSLSANQGKELKGLIDILKNTNHIGEFSTESELSTILNTEISGMDAWSNKTIRATATGDMGELFANGYIYYGTLFKGAATNDFCHVLFYSNVSTNVVSGSNDSSSSWTFYRLATTNNINTVISNLESSHFGSLGNVSNPVTSRNSIPLNWVGNVVFDSSVSPSGTTRSYSVIKFGLNATRYFIIAIDQYANKMYLFENYDETIRDWRRIDPEYAFGLPNTSIPENATLASYLTPGTYYIPNTQIAATISDCPYKSSGGRLEVIGQISDTAYQRHMYYPAGTPDIYTRVRGSSTWGNWYKFTMVQV